MFYARGINYYNIDDKYTSIHAEVNAVQKLPPTQKRIKVDVFVFRTNRKGNILTMSKPCDNCMNYIHKNLAMKGYRLNRIYYTDFQGYLQYI